MDDASWLGLKQNLFGYRFRVRFYFVALPTMISETSIPTMQGFDVCGTTDTAHVASVGTTVGVRCMESVLGD